MLFNVDAVVYSDTKPQGDPPTRCREFDFGPSRNDPPSATLCPPATYGPAAAMRPYVMQMKRTVPVLDASAHGGPAAIENGAAVTRGAAYEATN